MQFAHQFGGWWKVILPQNHLISSHISTKSFNLNQSDAWAKSIWFTHVSILRLEHEDQNEQCQSSNHNKVESGPFTGLLR